MFWGQIYQKLCEGILKVLQLFCENIMQSWRELWKVSRSLKIHNRGFINTALQMRKQP